MIKLQKAKERFFSEHSPTNQRLEGDSLPKKS